MVNKWSVLYKLFPYRLGKTNKPRNLGGGDMTDPVKLTQTIQDLIVQLGAINPTLVTVFANKADIDVQTIIDWFAQTRFIKSDENTFF